MMFFYFILFLMPAAFAADNQTDSEIFELNDLKEKIVKLENKVDENQNKTDELLNQVLKSFQIQNNSFKTNQKLQEKILENQEILMDEHLNHTNSSNINFLTELTIDTVYLIITLIVAGTAAVAGAYNHRRITEILHNMPHELNKLIVGSDVKPEENKDPKKIGVSDKNVKIPEQLKFKEKIIVKKEKIETDVDSKFTNIYNKIGQDKISKLLQESKLIAIQENDDKIAEWMEDELVGYLPSTPEPIKLSEAPKPVPKYRQITSKFGVTMPDGKVDTLSYPLWIGHSISHVEDWLKIFSEKPGAEITIKWTFKENIKLIKGQIVDLVLPETQLKNIVIAVERKLSEYLEEKIKTKKV